MKLDRTKLDKFLKAPDESIGALLFYGPDEGLAREYARAAQRAVLGAEDDPFRLAELTVDQIKEDEARLTDELNAISMLGGRRVVRVSRAGNAIAGAIEAAIEAQAAKGAALLIVEAGDIGSKAELVKVFEAAKRAGVLACYHDDDAKLGDLIRAHLKSGGYGISRDALAYLTERLGGDRAVTRGELDKLMLYVGPSDPNGPKGEISEQDAIACIGDRAAFALDDLIGAAADGDVIALDRNYTRSFAEVEAIQLLRNAARHFQRLHQIVARMAAGDSFESASAALRPPLFWNQRARMERQARLWAPRRIGRALERLIEAEAQAMRSNRLKNEIAQRALLEIASLVRRPHAPPAGGRRSA
jgi:DNA polymerase-3 subunit delta